MNIGIDINSLLASSRTGVAEYTFELLNALFAIDKKNQYFLFSNSLRKNVDDEMWNQKNVHFIHTRVPNKIFHTVMQLTRRPFLDSLLVKKYEQKHKIKIGHLDVFFSPNIGFSSLTSKCKKILTIHDLSFELFPECFSLKMRMWHRLLRPKKQCEEADLIIVPSHNTERDVVDIYNIPSQKIRVVSPGLSSLFFEKQIVPNEQHINLIKEKYHLPKKFILFLGTLEPRKNIEAVIEAFALFRAHHEKASEYTLVIAGSKGWKYAKIQKSMAQTTGVHYIGYVQAQDKPILYQSASLFVYPSFYEGFGFPVLEAMASGVPVITSNRSSLPEITEGAAYLVDPHNVEEIKTGMERILFTETVKQSLSHKGQTQAQKFQWSQTAEEFLHILTQ